MSALPYFIDVKKLKGDYIIRDKILKVLYESGEQFTSVRFTNCGNPNQWFAELQNLEITSFIVIPKSNGTKLRFISEEKMEKAKEYLERRGIISIQDEANRSN